MVSSVNNILEDSMIYDPCVISPGVTYYCPGMWGCTYIFKSQELLNTTLILTLFSIYHFYIDRRRSKGYLFFPIIFLFHKNDIWKYPVQKYSNVVI